MAAVSLSISENYQAMKTIAIKARRMPSLSGVIKRIDSFIVSKSVTIASISTATCYLGVLFQSDITIGIAGLTAILAVYNFDRKGGQA